MKALMIIIISLVATTTTSKRSEEEYNYATCLDSCYKAYCISNVTNVGSYCVDWELRNYCQGTIVSNYETTKCSEYRNKRQLFVIGIISSGIILSVALAALMAFIIYVGHTEEVKYHEEDDRKGVRPDVETNPRNYHENSKMENEI